MERAQDIFLRHNLYPFTGKIKDHFAGTYDEILIVFLPFYDQRIKEGISEVDIVQKVKVIPWETVCRGARINEPSELYKALKISIGALPSASISSDLPLKLKYYLEEHGIQAPEKGAYDTFTKVAIFKTFEILGKRRVVVTDEFYESTYIIELSEFDAIAFSKKIARDAYYIYPEDKSFLFTMEWDSFFYLFAGGKQEMKIIQELNLFEGFLCDTETTHNWYVKED